MVCLITAPKIADKQALFLGLLRIEAVALYPSLYRGYHHGIVADPATGERKKKRDSFDENAVELWPTLGEAGGRTGMDGLKTNFTDARWIGGQTDRQTDRQTGSLPLSLPQQRDERSGEREARLHSSGQRKGLCARGAAHTASEDNAVRCGAEPLFLRSARLPAGGEKVGESLSVCPPIHQALTRAPKERPIA